MEKKQESTNVFYFPNGLPGFEELHYFKLIDEEDDIFAQLISVENEEIGFIIIRPGHILPDYLDKIEIDDNTAQTLNTQEQTEVDVWAILKLNHKDVMQSSVNLRAPLIINNKDKLGAQIILADERYSSREPLFRGHPEKTVEGAGDDACSGA